MKEWLTNLEPRERRALIIAAVFILVTFTYAFAWKPFAKHYAQAEKTVQSQKETLVWMQQAAAEVKALRAQQQAHTGIAGGQSLLAVVDDSAKKAELGEFIRRVEPQGAKQVQIWLENAPFDTVATWFSQLQSDYGVAVVTLSVVRQQLPGTVNVHVLLQGASS